MCTSSQLRTPSEDRTLPVLVSIAIPTYTRSEYLREAIESACAQTHSALEILISDDGANHAVERVAKEAAGKDSRIRYWRNEKTLGLAGNWNRCVNQARGRYILIIGDDDRLLPHALSKLITSGEEDVIFGSNYLIDSTGARLLAATREAERRYQRDTLIPGPLSRPEKVVWANSVPICAALIRTSLARKIRFKEDLNTPEIVFFAELARRGARFRFVKDYVAEYRLHGASMTAAGLRNDRLALYLIDMPVDAEIEIVKRTLLIPIMRDAVSRAILLGDGHNARLLLRSRYYPSWRSMTHTTLAQRACLALPDRIACRSYRLLWSFLRALRSRRYS